MDIPGLVEATPAELHYRSIHIHTHIHIDVSRIYNYQYYYVMKFTGCIYKTGNIHGLLDFLWPGVVSNKPIFPDT